MHAATFKQYGKFAALVLALVVIAGLRGGDAKSAAHASAETHSCTVELRTGPHATAAAAASTRTPASAGQLQCQQGGSLPCLRTAAS